MVGNIARIVAQFKQSWSRELEDEAILAACRSAGHRWRERELGPVATVKMFLLQILFGNVACNFVPRLAAKDVTGSAYCEARARLPLAALQTLLTRSTAKMAESVRDTGRWLGHRLFLVDGSSFSMPDTPELREHFGQSGQQVAGCGFPTAHWLVLLHAGTGMIAKMLAAPLRTHDLSGAVQLHPELRAGDLLVADRGFCSYAHLALLFQRGVHGCLRIHQRTIVDFTPGRAHVHPRGGKAARKTGRPRSRWIEQIGATDQIVEWFKPRKGPQWMSDEQYAALPTSLTVRELHYTIHEKGFRPAQIALVTTLLDAQRYTLSELAQLYRQRWEIETNLAHLKTTMKLDVLKCKTEEGVLRELAVFALIYNMVRQVMLAAARRQRVTPNRISFVDALRWLQTAQPNNDLPNLVVNPQRDHRHEPRVRKRRPKEFPLMKKPRRQLKKELQRQ